jgi:hypothetical protein
MRELVYASDRKRRQFTKTPPRHGWLRRLGLEGEFSIPGVGKAKATKPATQEAAPPPSLDEVIEFINNGERPVRWYSDPEVRAGEWVHFEADINYQVLSDAGLETAVLFVNSTPIMQHEGNNSVRLLLHGSSEHLLERSRPKVQLSLNSNLPQTCLIGRDPCSSDTYWVYEMAGRMYSFDSTLEGQLSCIGRALKKAEDSILTPQHVTLTLPSPSVRSGICLLIDVLDGILIPETAALMAGLARVTATFSSDDPSRQWQELVVASPLYVEHPPQQPDSPAIISPKTM